MHGSTSPDGSSGPEPSRDDWKRHIFFERFQESFSEDAWRALQQEVESMPDVPSTKSLALALAATHASDIVSDELLSSHELLVPAIPLAQALRSDEWRSTVFFRDDEGVATSTDEAARYCFDKWYKGGYKYDRPKFELTMDPKTLAAARFLMTVASSAHYSELIKDMANSHISSNMGWDTANSLISSEMTTHGEMDAKEDDAEIRVEAMRELDERKQDKKGRKASSPVPQLGTPSISDASALSHIDDIPVLHLATPSSQQMTSPGLGLDLSDAGSSGDADESQFGKTDTDLDLDVSDAGSLNDVDESQFDGMEWE